MELISKRDRFRHYCNTFIYTPRIHKPILHHRPVNAHVNTTFISCAEKLPNAYVFDSDGIPINGGKSDFQWKCQFLTNSLSLESIDCTTNSFVHNSNVFIKRGGFVCFSLASRISYRMYTKSLFETQNKDKRSTAEHRILLMTRGWCST